MKKFIGKKCDVCGHTESKYHVECDTCGKDISLQYKQDEYRFLNVYEDYDDGSLTDNLEFCSWKCLFDWIRDFERDDFRNISFNDIYPEDLKDFKDALGDES